MEYFVGIDPQQNNISICILDSNGNPVIWKQIALQLRKTFPSACDWQRHICTVVTSLVNEFLCSVPVHKVSSIDIEQQRGRLNSIVEQTLFFGFLRYVNSCRTVHPRMWRRCFPFLKKGKSNYENKKASKENAISVLKEYHEKNGYGKADDLLKNERVHDLCDAYLIAKSNWIKSKLIE